MRAERCDEDEDWLPLQNDMIKRRLARKGKERKGKERGMVSWGKKHRA
jgi:hypothetical protein